MNTLLQSGYDSDIIKYMVMKDCKIKLEIMLNRRVGNKYLKMEILKIRFPNFTEYELFSLFC